MKNLIPLSELDWLRKGQGLTNEFDVNMDGMESPIESDDDLLL